MTRIAQALAAMTLRDWLFEGGLVTLNVALWGLFLGLVLS